MVQACRVVQIPVSSYLIKAFAPVVACVSLPIALLGIASAWRPPESWLELLVYTLAFGLLYCSACLPFCSDGQVKALALTLVRRFYPRFMISACQ